MWDMIVLGQVPGTQIQISFLSWLLFSIGLVAGLSAFGAMRAVKHANFITALRIRHIMRTAAYTQWLVMHDRLQA